MLFQFRNISLDIRELIYGSYQSLPIVGRTLRRCHGILMRYGTSLIQNFEEDLGGPELEWGENKTAREAEESREKFYPLFPCPQLKV